MTCEEFLDNVDALALGALSVDETAAAEQHLAGCADCARELRLARAVAERLPLSAPAMRAPAALRDRVLAAVGAEAAGGSSAGISAGSASRPLDAPVAAQADNVRPFIRPETPAETADPASVPASRTAVREPVQISGWRRLVRGGLQVPALAAAVAVLAVVGLAAWSVSLQNQLSDVKHQQSLARNQQPGFLPASQAALTLLASQHTVTSQLDPTQSATATGGVIWNPNEKKCVVLVQQLAPPPANAEYHIWFTNGNAKWDGGALTPDGSGSGFKVIDMSRWNVGEGYHIAVVLQPTPDNGQHQPVLGGDLHASLQ